MELQGEVLTSLMSVLMVIFGISIIMALVWFVLRRLTQRWRNQFIESVAEIQLMLKQVKENLEQTTRQAQAYSPADQEPYGSIAQELYQTLPQIQDIHAAQTQQLAYLCKKTLAPPDHRLAWLWFGFWTEPHHHWQRYQVAEQLRQSTEEPKLKIDQAKRLLETLQGIPLTVAHRSKTLYRTNEEIGQIAHSLYEAGLRGQLIDSATDEAKQLEAQLRNLPVRFFQELDSLILKESDKQSTILAWQTLTELEAPTQKSLGQFQQWQALYREVGQNLQFMRQAVNRAREQFNDAPATIDMSSFAAELEQAEVETGILEARYRSPTIEILGELSEHISRVTENSNWLSKQLDTLSKRFTYLHAAIILNADLLAQTTTKMRAASEVAQYPLVWQQSREELERLRQLEIKIGPIEARRTLTDLEQHLQMANALSMQAQILKSTVVEIQAQRDKLGSLLARSELAAEPAWLIQAKSLHKRVALYEASNWPREDEVKRIGPDADKLASRQKALLPGRIDDPLPAEQLGHYLNDVQALVGAIETLQVRLQRIEDTLTSLQSLEQAAQQRLERVLQAIEPLLKRLKTVEFLPGSAVADYPQQLDKLQQEGYQLDLMLAKRKTGLVKDKDKHTTDWVQACQTTLRTLQEALLAEIKRTENQLNNQIKGLQMVGSFDREGAMREAKRLLQLEHSSIAPSADPESQLGLLVEQVSHLLQRQVDLQRLLETLVTQISDRVNTPYQTMKSARQEALTKFENLVKTQAKTRTDWPPTICNPTQAKKLLDDAERDFHELKKSGSTSDVLSRLARLIKRYEDVTVEVNKRVDEVRQQQHNLQDILDRIEYWRRQLKVYGELHRQDIAIRQAVDERLKMIEVRLAEAQKSRLSYDQATLVLKELWQTTYQNLRIKRDKIVETIQVDQIESV